MYTIIITVNTIIIGVNNMINAMFSWFKKNELNQSTVIFIFKIKTWSILDVI